MTAQHTLYRRIWRWHFYAGLFVIPFMLVLALSGMALLLKPQLESLQFGDWLTVPEMAQQQSPDVLLKQVKRAFPNAGPHQFIAAKNAGETSRFVVKQQQQSILVFIDPYRAVVVGSIPLADTWYAIADDIHGTLLLGKSGDALLEAAAGLCLFLLMSGLYLHWPRSRNASLWKLPLRQYHKRFSWRQLHGALGIWLSVVLVFFALSGLAWTGVWGQKLVQPWSSFPAEKSARFWNNYQAETTQAATPTTHIHGNLNSDNLEEVPWAVEQLPVPLSQPHHAHQPLLSLADIMAQGKALGLDYFRVSFPRGERGVYSLISSTTSGDISNPLNDRTVHIDPHSGDILADIGWADYNLLAKTMAAGIALHKGEVSAINLWVNMLACALLILLSIAGAVLWFKRRSVRRPQLSLPPHSNHSGHGWRLLLTLSAVLFPLSGVVLLLIALLDSLLNRRQAS